MSFTENAKKVVTDTAESVVKASGEFVENSKLKYKIYDAGIDKKRLLEKLGKLVYAEHRGEVEDYADKKEKLCTEIADIDEYIDQLKNQIK